MGRSGVVFGGSAVPAGWANRRPVRPGQQDDGRNCRSQCQWVLRSRRSAVPLTIHRFPVGPAQDRHGVAVHGRWRQFKRDVSRGFIEGTGKGIDNIVVSALWKVLQLIKERVIPPAANQLDVAGFGLGTHRLGACFLVLVRIPALSDTESDSCRTPIPISAGQ